MKEKRAKQYICLRSQIEDEDYEKIKELEEICLNHDKVNLKLELEFKLSIRKEYDNLLKNINEFIYFADDKVVGYLGISCFGGNEAEINGMVHPDWRRNGVFERLLDLAKEECARRSFDKILLLCDAGSESGKKFIEAAGAKYSFSEYKMKLGRANMGEESKSLAVRKAKNCDAEEISRLNSIFFGKPDVQITYPEEEEKSNRITYLSELNGKIIGKIRIESSNNSSYIYGFGVLPEYRGKGYGRETLKSALNIIYKNNIRDVYLDVASENNTALNLYKSCGFDEISVMNYYEG